MTEAGRARVQGQNQRDIEPFGPTTRLARGWFARVLTGGAVAGWVVAAREEAGREAAAPQRVPMLNWPATLFVDEVRHH